ncbi:CASP-like protein 2C1, partial [Linum perenne]
PLFILQYSRLPPHLPFPNYYILTQTEQHGSADQGPIVQMKRVVMAECGLRSGAVLSLVAAACLVGFDSETEFVLFAEKRVTYKDLNSLTALVYVDIAAAAYNLTRLVVMLVMRRCRSEPSKSNGETASFSMVVVSSWVGFILDQQVGVYVTFAATLAALQHSTLVITGENELQWLKWCNKFTRFCVQIGGGLFASFVASILMSFMSFVSAFHLFSLYSPNRFLLLKSSSSPPRAS